MSNFAFKKVSVCSFTNSVIRSVCTLVGSEREILFDQDNLRKKNARVVVNFCAKKIDARQFQEKCFSI